jgi:hypothetical protein
MRKKLSVESLAVESYATQAPEDSAPAVAPLSRYYSECYSCGIACTAFICV